MMTAAMVGKSIGHFKITAELGTGGMGDVAIKARPDTFYSDVQRRSRFEREAHLLASLNHPHGCINRARSGLWGAWAATPRPTRPKFVKKLDSDKEISSG